MKICLIGTLGGARGAFDGQSVRTNILYNALIQKYGKKKICLVDTYQYRKRAFSVLFQALRGIFSCRHIIVIVSGNGQRVFFPILAKVSRIFGKKIYNNVIGGDLDIAVKSYPKFLDYTNEFCVNWVQMPSMKARLEEMGMKHVEVLPNSKPMRVLADEEITEEREEAPFRFCTFSRVAKTKGIGEAVDAIRAINKKAGKTIATLTIYGRIDLDYTEEFEELQKGFEDFIHFGGSIPFDKAPETLKNYFCLLFPTTFIGEGFPATVLDAFSSATPIIATDWRYNGELIEEGKTGFLYDPEKPHLLEEKIQYAIDHPEEIAAMRPECLKIARLYTPEKVMPIIFNKIEENN